MEESSYSLRITLSRICRMVHPGQHVHRMEIVSCLKIATMGPWETSVIPQKYGLAEINVFVFVAGAGKTVFWYAVCSILPFREFMALGSSAVIEDIDAMRKAGLASLAFFYCDFREDQKKELRGLLSSLLVQLSHQSDSYYDILYNFYSEHAKGQCSPSDGALAECLKDVLKLAGLASVYLIVDALDECPESSTVRSPRAKVLSFIEELFKSQIPNLRICVTSRPEVDIKDVLDPLIFGSVSLHDEGTKGGHRVLHQVSRIHASKIQTVESRAHTTGRRDRKS